MVTSIAIGQNALCPLTTPSRKGNSDSQFKKTSTNVENVEIPGQLKKNGIKVSKIGKVR